MRRIALPVGLFLVWTPAAYAWSWPLQGPVLQPFAYDQAHPYASGQHRGIDIGAEAVGERVVAPAAGSVSFVGTVPTSGKSVTIETSDGYSVTLTHLGASLVASGVTVAEGDAVGTVGPSGTPEVDGPYVHLGIRLTADPNGYVDPLGLLPPAVAESPPAEDDTTAPSQPSAGGTSSAPASEPAPPVPVTASATPGNTRGTGVESRPSRRGSRERGDTSRPEVERPSSMRPTVHVPASSAAPREAARPSEHRPGEPRRPAHRRPIGQTAALSGRIGLDRSRELEPGTDSAELPTRRQPSLLPEFALNGAAALVALAAAILAGCRSRRRPGTNAVTRAVVLQLPRPASDWRRRTAA